MERKPVTRKRRAGFTLLEILLGMSIFAIGGVAVLSLFIANANRAERAANDSRAVNIAASVRSTLEAALRSPPMQLDGGERRLYPIAFPFATLDPAFSRLRSQAGVDYELNRPKLDSSKTYFFELPKDPFRGRDSTTQAFTVLPKDLLNQDGRAIEVLGGQAMNRVLFMKPSAIGLAGNERLGDDLDIDDADAYAFSFFITRSVERSPYTIRGTKPLLEGLYVVQLRVFKGYDLTPGANNAPIQEFTFTLGSQE